jgi:VWFA-related protein
MSIYVHRCLLFFAVLLFGPVALAQQPSRAAQPDENTIRLNVVVAHKSEPPVSGLQQQDFTILDNNVPQTITGFQAVDSRQRSIQVIFLIDAVNAPYQAVSYERGQIDKVLRSEGGELSHPTELMVLTDTGLQQVHGFSTDGNTLSASLDQYSVALRSIVRSTGFYGAAERFQLSLEGLHELMQREAARPGRKIVLCFSPGWPLLSGPEVELSNSERRQFFADIEDFSTAFGRDNVTLYSIDAWGANEPLGREVYWQNFDKGISKPSQVDAGDLALQVLASQSGGLVLNSNDVAAEIQQALADTRAYYEVSFVPSNDDRPDRYHRLEVRVEKNGLKARTRQGYYSGSNVGGELKIPTPIESRGRM